MDNKVLDEAVEVALRASDEAAEQQDFSASEDDGLSEAKAVMRAAILASFPVLLGEPVAWLWSHPSVNDGEWIDSRVPPSDEPWEGS